MFCVLKICCESKASSSYVLNFHQFLGILSFRMFLKIHAERRGLILINEGSFCENMKQKKQKTKQSILLL